MSKPQLPVPGPFADFAELMLNLPGGSATAVEAVRAHNLRLAKPVGALGEFETIVEFLARWQEKPEPTLENPLVAIFAGSHGIAKDTLPGPAGSNAERVARLTDGGAAVSLICAENQLNLRVFELALQVPTGDITLGPALDDRACAATIAYGMEAIAGSPDLLCLGEVGIGGETAAAAILAALYGGSGADWVVADAEISGARQAALIDRALSRHADHLDHPFHILARLGGRETAAMLGALIAARHHRIPVIVEGHAAFAAAAVAHAINPAMLDHCLFALFANEGRQKRVLDQMGRSAILNLPLGLGEGAGAALAAALCRMALNIHQHMAVRAS